MTVYQIWCEHSSWDGCNGVNTREYLLPGVYSSYEKAAQDCPKNDRDIGFSRTYSIKPTEII